MKTKFDALVNHPHVGSVWMTNVRLCDGYVTGDVWDSRMVGFLHIPDDYRGENVPMNFPVSCVRKIQRVA